MDAGGAVDGTLDKPSVELAAGTGWLGPDAAWPGWVCLARSGWAAWGMVAGTRVAAGDRVAGAHQSGQGPGT